MLKLMYPLEYEDKQGKQIIEELEFYPLTLEHLDNLPDDTFDSEGNVNFTRVGRFVKACCRLSQEAVNKIDIRDLPEVLEYVRPFLQKSL